LGTVLSISQVASYQSPVSSLQSWSSDRVSIYPDGDLKDRLSTEGWQLATDSPQHYPGGSQFVIQQPPLLGEASAIADQATVLAHHPVARNQDSEVIGRH
jgi:hypothetical protein